MAKPATRQFYDQRGILVEEFDVLEVFHFIGPRRRRNYMYKWVRQVKGHLVGMHLCSSKPGNYFDLRSIADDTGRLKGCEIIQSPHWEKLK